MLSEDLSLWSNVKQGKEEAYRALFDRYYPELCRDAMRFVSVQAASEDIAQDVFVTLWVKRDTIEISHSVRAYLKRSVTNRALNYLEKHKREVQLDHKQHDPPSPEELSTMSRHELVKIVQHSIEQLPEKRKAIFLMRRYQSMSYRDIAEELDISERTVEVHLRKARLFLREILKPYLDHIVPIFVIICTYVRDFTFLLVLILCA